MDNSIKKLIISIMKNNCKDEFIFHKPYKFVIIIFLDFYYITARKAALHFQRTLGMLI